MTRLNLGCGNDRLPGYTNVDRVPSPSVDRIHDLNEMPYPWPNDSIDEIRMWHVLEHLNSVQAVLDECWRILTPSGVLRIRVPHFSHFQALTHPEHRHCFSVDSLQMFTPSAREPYTLRLWRIDSRLVFQDRLSNWLFNRCPQRYTQSPLVWLWPAVAVDYEMRPL